MWQSVSPLSGLQNSHRKVQSVPFAWGVKCENTLCALEQFLKHIYSPLTGLA